MHQFQCFCKFHLIFFGFPKIFKLKVTFQMLWTQGANENMVPDIVRNSRSLYEYLYYNLSIICEIKPKAMGFIRTRACVKSGV